VSGARSIRRLADKGSKRIKDPSTKELLAAEKADEVTTVEVVRVTIAAAEPPTIAVDPKQKRALMLSRLFFALYLFKL